jgi:hypothetical protein
LVEISGARIFIRTISGVRSSFFSILPITPSRASIDYYIYVSQGKLGNPIGIVGFSLQRNIVAMHNEIFPTTRAKTSPHGKEPVMAGKRVLVPFNFSDYDERALHYVIRNYAGQPWAYVTIFHAYTPLPQLDGYTNPSVRRVKSSMAAMWREVREKEQDLQNVLQDLLVSGFSKDRLDYIFKARDKSIGEEIAQACREREYHTVVLCRKPGKASGILSRSVHDRLLSSLRDKEIVIIT